MFNTLREINKRPELFSEFTVPNLWTDSHISKKMLEYHLDGDVDLASRNYEFIERSVDWIARRFKINSETKICDFGCGPGLYTSKFAKLGADVTGIDFSESSVNYAREKAREEKLLIDYILGDYLEFKSNKKFDLITMIYCDFCALTPDRRAVLLNIFRARLNPGGSVLLDVFSHSYFESLTEDSKIAHSERDGFWSADPYILFENTCKYDSEKISLAKYTIVESNRRREFFNWLQCYNPEILQNEFMANGLRIKEFYSDTAGADYSCETAQFAVSAEII